MDRESTGRVRVWAADRGADRDDAGEACEGIVLMGDVLGTRGSRIRFQTTFISPDRQHEVSDPLSGSNYQSG